MAFKNVDTVQTCILQLAIESVKDIKCVRLTFDGHFLITNPNYVSFLNHSLTIILFYHLGISGSRYVISGGK